MSNIIISPTTHACFIEAYRTTTLDARIIIDEWLKHSPNKIKFKDYMRLELSIHYHDVEMVWNAILDNDHIWCRSSFEGASAALFCSILKYAEKYGVKNKIFFDLFERTTAIKNITRTCPSAKEIIKQLEAENNIQFFFLEDIFQMM